MRGHDLRITVRAGVGGSFVAVAEHTPPGTPDPDDPHALHDAVQVGESTVHREHLPAIRLLEQWLRRWEWIAQAASQGKRRDLLVPGTFDVLGDLLWQVAFQGEVGDALHRIREQARGERAGDSGSVLRVRLGFGQGAEDFATLPWEFLRSPRFKFLAQDPFVVFGRFFEGSGETEVRLAADQVMRVLVIVALPEGAGYAAERDEIFGLVEQMNLMRRLTIECIPRWDMARIRSTLEAQNDEGAPNLDVIHLVAVCSDRDASRPKLLMPNAQGDPEFFDPDPTVQALTSLVVVPSLVVLHLSEGDTDPSAHFEQLAPAFIDAGIPSVLAMQYPMPPEKGREFVTNFYSGLASGEQVGTAIHTARRQLGDVQSNRQFGTPVLYLQSRADGILLEGPASLEGDEDAVATVPAPTVHTTRSEAPAPILPGTTEHLGQRVGAMLVRQLQRMPEPSRELEDWLAARVDGWPDDLDAISTTLRGLQRQHDDDPAYVAQVSALMDVVRRVRVGAGHA
jgi:hypothetical protein